MAKKKDFEYFENGKKIFSFNMDYFLSDNKTKMKLLIFLLHFIIIELNSINISKD